MGCSESKPAPAKTQKSAPASAKPAAKKEEPKAAPAPAVPKEAPVEEKKEEDAKPVEEEKPVVEAQQENAEPAKEEEKPGAAGEAEPAAVEEKEPEAEAEAEAEAEPAVAKEAEPAAETDKIEGPLTLRMVRLSTNCIAPWVLLDKCGIDFTIADVDLMGGETRTPEYLEMNPMHCVPTLSAGDFHLWESNAIMRFICNAYPAGKAFYPSTPEEIALTELALDFKQTALAPCVTKIAYPILGFASFTEEESAEALKKLTEGDDSVFAVMETKFLKDRAFVGGDVTSIGDLALVAGMKFLEVADIEFPAAIKAYIDRVSTAVDLPKYYAGEGLYGLDAHFAMVREKKAAAAAEEPNPAVEESNPADAPADAEANPAEEPAAEETPAPPAPVVEEPPKEPEPEPKEETPEPPKPASPKSKPAGKSAVRKPAGKATPKPGAKSGVKKPAAKK